MSGVGAVNCSMVLISGTGRQLVATTSSETDAS